MAQKKPGFMLYFEDYDSLRATLCAEDIVSVLDAMVCQSRTGAFSDDEKLSEAARICWRFLKPRVERDSQQYAERVKKRRDAANARWGIQHAVDANACNCTEEVHLQNSMPTQLNASQLNAVATHVSTSSSFQNVAEDELTADIERNRNADDLIRRYRLPDCDISRESLLEDAERVGWEKLEDALKQAAAANSRQGLSVNFYRAVLNSAGREGIRDGRRSDPYGGYGAL